MDSNVKWYPQRLLKTVDRRLNFTADDIGREAVGKALELVPVKSGALQASIQVNVSKHNDELKEVTVYSDLPYAPVIELGSRNSPPQPFLMPAIDSVRNKIRSMIDKAKNL